MSVKTLVYPVPAVQVTPTAGAATTANQILEIAELEAQTALLTSIAGLTVQDQIDTTPLLDTSVTNIPDSASAPVEIVASLSADIKKILSVEDIGEYMGLYVGAALSETLLAILPLGGGEVSVIIDAGERVSLRAMESSSITSGKIAINFLG